jgi:hypothetical protein
MVNQGLSARRVFPAVCGVCATVGVTIREILDRQGDGQSHVLAIGSREP